MNLKKNIFTLISTTILFSCNNVSEKMRIDEPIIDTTKSFKIEDNWVTPKQNFDFISVQKLSSDTLDLVSCGEYVYSPFGLLKNKYDLKNSLLKNFNISESVDSTDAGITEFQNLKIKSSSLTLFFDNDSEGVKRSYVFLGEIKDSEVNFFENVKIGMSIYDFHKTFFNDFPKELKNKFKVIIFHSCVLDIDHIYSFQDNKLSSVKFNGGL